MAPEAIRRRMAHGNIYPPERVDAALGELLPHGQPRRAARARAAVGRRPRRRRAPGLPRPATASTARGRRANASSSRSPARADGEHARAPRRAHGGSGRRATSSACTCGRRTASPGRGRAARRAARARSRSSAGRYHEVVGADIGETLVSTRAQPRTRPRSCSEPAGARAGGADARVGDQPRDPRVGLGLDVHVISRPGRRRRVGHERPAASTPERAAAPPRPASDSSLARGRHSRC